MNIDTMNTFRPSLKYSLVSGLSVLILAPILVLGACSSTPTSRSTGQTIDDSVVAAQAKAALIDNESTKARNIDVRVFKGEVQLNGFVDSTQEKADATATVKRIDGVTSVRNNLQVQAGGDRSGGEVIDDSVITSKVKAALIADSRTKASQIEVTTKRGEVQLGGFVDSSGAKKAAEEVAGSVTGVKSVSNDLEVK